jgi:hypothetical protein
MIEPKLGFEYILWAQKRPAGQWPSRLAGPPLSTPEAPLCAAPTTGKRSFYSHP